MPLFLQSKGLLSRPNFYLSEYLESRRDEYYDRLLAVSRDGDWTGWCLFFLRALIAQAEANQARGRSLSHPTSWRTHKYPAPTANRILRVARAGGLIEEARPASGQRPALFRFAALLDIVEGPPAR